MAKPQLTKAELELNTELEGVEVTPAEVKVKNVEVNIAKEFRTYLGDKWWDFKIGKTTVPEHVKEYLKNVNALSAM